MKSVISPKFVWALVVLAVFVATTVLVTTPSLTPPAAAKGVTKTKPDDSSDSSSSKKEESKPKEEPKSEQKPESKPQSPAPPPVEKKSERRDEAAPSPAPSPSPPPVERKSERRDQPTSSRSEGNRSTTQPGDSPYGRNEEHRDTTAPSPTQRGPGTADIAGQIQKRSERRDAEYEFRRHYGDDFFYPYDEWFYRHYPYYDSGPVIIIHDRDQRAHKTWRRTYEYGRPAPGSVEEALVDIQATWREEDPEFLMWHVDPDGDVDIYYKGRYSHTLSARQIYKLTAEAIDRTNTREFTFRSVERDGYAAKAIARHVFVGPDGRTRTAYLAYHLVKLRNRWFISRIDFRKTDFGAPQCFIATAAYGTPRSYQVRVLREFRDRYLLPNLPGRMLTALYYRISPPIAEHTARSETARAVLRGLLEPVVQACRLAVSGIAEE